VFVFVFVCWVVGVWWFGLVVRLLVGYVVFVVSGFGWWDGVVVVFDLVLVWYVLILVVC